MKEKKKRKIIRHLYLGYLVSAESGSVLGTKEKIK
jgi:hypothetical protein